MPTDPVYPVTQQKPWIYAEVSGTFYFDSTDASATRTPTPTARTR